MLQKVCPFCKKTAYGLSEFALLLCPYCESNLRYVEAEPVIECMWCDERMAKTQDGGWVCPQCGWRYKEAEK